MAYTAHQWATIRERLKEKYESKVFWTNDEALRCFNESLYVWNWCTGTWKRRETMLTVANQLLYALSASMLYRMRITFNSQAMSPTSREDLNNGRYQWRADRTTTGSPVPTRPMLWAPNSLRSVFIWPADAVGGGTLTIDGVAATPILTNDADTLDVNDALLTTLLNYALHALTFKKGGPAFASTQSLFKAFLASAAEENSEIKTSQIYRRIMGIDRRDLKPLRGAPNELDSVVSS